MSKDQVQRPAGGRIRLSFDWTFRNRKTGRLTFAQFPNLSLAIFLVASLVRRFVHLADTPRTVLEVVAAVSLAWWAIDEIIRGVNPWRRFLGATVLTVLVVEGGFR